MDVRRTLYREILWHDPHLIHAGVAARCTPAIAAIAAAGLLTGEQRAAAIVCGGALTVGSGVYQRLAQSQAGPMVAATLGMGLSAFVGTLAGLAPVTLALAVAFWGLAAGLLPALGPGAQWTGQQCAIAVLVAASFPGGIEPALVRGGLVMAGGVAQVLSVEALLRFGDVRTELKGWPETLAHARAGWRTLRAAMRWQADPMRFALRVGATLAAAVVSERVLALPNGYWVGMTALILLRPDFHDTFHRGASRIVGTVAGAGIALLAWRAGPPDWALAAFVPAAAFLCFAFQRFSYAVYSTCMTAFIVFLLSFGGAAAPAVADNRIVGTLLGAAFALAGHLHFALGGGMRGRAGARG